MTIDTHIVRKYLSEIGLDEVAEVIVFKGDLRDSSSELKCREVIVEISDFGETAGECRYAVSARIKGYEEAHFDPEPTLETALSNIYIGRITAHPIEESGE